MRILYGVVGEGMGHAIRSRVTIEHLIRDEGHEVEVVVSGRASEVLRDYFPEVHRIWGLSMTFEDSEFKVGRSILDNLKAAIGGGFDDNIAAYFEMTDDFEPDCVISDFESWAYFYGVRHQLPIICIDNIQMVARCEHPDELTRLHRKDFELARAFTAAKLPGCAHYYITTFFDAPVHKQRTTLVPPVLRPRILEATTSLADHVLVYQTSTTCADLPQVLASVDRPFRVYGYRRDIDEQVVEGNVTYCPFDEVAFMADLASCQAAISSAGFTLLSEAVYLHKPVLAIPMEGQFEQVLNAYYLEKLGYGFSMDQLDAPTVAHFLERLDEYRGHLASYRQERGNGELFELLDQRLDRIAADID
jgi:uncharacterized protein (TIGR00661 family)